MVLAIANKITGCVNVSGNRDVDEFIYFTQTSVSNNYNIANYMYIIDKNNPLNVYNFITNEFQGHFKLKVEWISYYQITDLTQIAEGGFGVVYRGVRLNPVTNLKEVVEVKN